MSHLFHILCSVLIIVGCVCTWREYHIIEMHSDELHFIDSTKSDQVLRVTGISCLRRVEIDDSKHFVWQTLLQSHDESTKCWYLTPNVHREVKRMPYMTGMWGFIRLQFDSSIDPPRWHHVISSNWFKDSRYNEIIEPSDAALVSFMDQHWDDLEIQAIDKGESASVNLSEKSVDLVTIRIPESLLDEYRGQETKLGKLPDSRIVFRFSIGTEALMHERMSLTPNRSDKAGLDE